MQHIRIISPAKAIEKEHLENAEKFLRENGYKVSFGKHAFGMNNYFSGTDAERLQDVQEAFDDEDVDVILCARGGYGIVRIIDQIDFTKFLNSNKKLMGYSDVTVFHNHIFGKYGKETIHSTVPLNFIENTADSLESLLNAIEGRELNYNLKAHELNIQGDISAEVIGGNLSILYSLIGTDSDLDYDDKLLFIEEIGEAIYAIDRMLYSMKKADKLSKLKGLIVGGLTSVKDSAIPFGKSAEEVIYEHASKLGIPVCFNFPAGHIPDNRSIIIGREAKLSVNSDEVRFEQ
ncbi:MAG: LD-carboxypeptidase [Crocinitomicaceae bacterium]|nr:LD-carboxypeptidase [Crocinitomicaceae bacterium]